MSSPEGQKLGAALQADEGDFIDHSKSSAFIVEEHEFGIAKKSFESCANLTRALSISNLDARAVTIVTQVVHCADRCIT